MNSDLELSLSSKRSSIFLTSVSFLTLNLHLPSLQYSCDCIGPSDNLNYLLKISHLIISTNSFWLLKKHILNCCELGCENMSTIPSLQRHKVHLKLCLYISSLMLGYPASSLQQTLIFLLLGFPNKPHFTSTRLSWKSCPFGTYRGQN